MDGKKKKRGGILIAKPDYKKAYVTLRNRLSSISPDLFPIRLIEEDKKNLNKPSKSSFVEGDEAKNKSHWLEGNGKPQVTGGRWRGRDRGSYPGGGGKDHGASQGGAGSSGQVKFPWSSMKSSSSGILLWISHQAQIQGKWIDVQGLFGGYTQFDAAQVDNFDTHFK